MPMGAIAAVGAIGLVVGSLNSRRAAADAREQNAAFAASAERDAAASEASAEATLDFNKKVYEDGAGDRAFASDMSKKVANNQFEDSVTQQGRATEQWDRYLKTFAPVEDRTANEAMNIDSQNEQDRVAGDAAGAVQAQSDGAQAQRARSQASMGINPNSGAAIAADSDAALSLAAGKAGTMNAARQSVRDRGVAMRAGVANFGRNMPNTTATMSGLSTASGNSGVGNATNPINVANSGANQMNQGFGAQAAGMNAAAGIRSGIWSNAMGVQDRDQRQIAAEMAGWGSLMGAGISGYAYKNRK